MNGIAISMLLTLIRQLLQELQSLVLAHRPSTDGCHQSYFLNL